MQFTNISANVLKDSTPQVIQGDALSTMRGMQGQIFDAVVTDPPYSSGGKTLAEKQQSTATKYTGSKQRCKIPCFEGDSLDQRSWTRWMAEILRSARELSKPGAPICVFTDWRQLPSLSDALQWAGWCWRGIVIWDKVNARPQRGRFRQQSEYIVWGSNGDMPVSRPVQVLPGVYRVMPPTQAGRRHQTEKPLELMRGLVRICEPCGMILDPFCGSGTTLHAAALEGYRAVGIECSAHYAAVARERLQQVFQA
jgi:site-specific DNA-methyltransferase (adenine-specific)